MTVIIKHIENCPVIDQRGLWNQIKSVAMEDKLTTLLQQGGVKFHDTNHRFIAEPMVALTGVGGIPLHLHDRQRQGEIALALAPERSFDLKDLKTATHLTMGMSAFCSYLNPKNIEPDAMCGVSFHHGHTSIAHTVVVNLLVLGHSCGVENEFNSQRDLIHISRLTVARTQAQKNPPLVVLDPGHLPLYQQILDHTLDVLNQAPETLQERPQLEGRNLLFPAAKGSMMMITASLRNLQKLMSGIHDSGKEEEYKRILIKMNQALSTIWDDLFMPTDQRAAA